MGSGKAQGLLEQEIVAERAGALARAVEALERTLRELHASAGTRRQAILLEARERLWFVVVQREAIGLTRHEVLYEVLRVPPEVRRSMGLAPRAR